MLSQRESGPVNDERVLVAQQFYDVTQNAGVVLFDVGEKLKRFATNLDVAVLKGLSPKNRRHK